MYRVSAVAVLALGVFYSRFGEYSMMASGVRGISDAVAALAKAFGTADVSS